MTLEGGALVLADQVGLNKIVNPCLLMLFELLNMEISEVFVLLWRFTTEVCVPVSWTRVSLNLLNYK